MAAKFRCLLCLVALGATIPAFSAHDAAGERLFTSTWRSVSGANRHLNRSLRAIATAVKTTVRVNPFTRSLLQTSSCLWDEEMSRCEPSAAVLVSLLRESENDLAVFLASALECGSLAEMECGNIEFCLWQSDRDRCVFVDFASGNEDSPCVTNAPATLEFYAAVHICQMETEEDSCTGIDNCEWDAESGTCSADSIAIFTGTSSEDLNAATDPIIDDMIQSTFEASRDAFNTNARRFDWERVLEWEIPEPECPEEADLSICAYSSAIVRSLSPTVLYCRGRYLDEDMQDDCDADPACMVDEDNGTCIAASSVISSATVAAVEALTSSAASSDSEILSTAVSCSSATEEETCNNPCRWDSVNSDCLLPAAVVVDTIASSAEDDSSGVCAYFATLSESLCFTITDEDACIENARCDYDDESGCSTANAHLVLEALREDESLEEEVVELAIECAAFTSEVACSA